ncbi:hypothetical protein DAPPUDRAFT_309438 [Daphnia pulex]|uniref:Uncharacterized protein n=1 Tax=Daphnia pulex TaxID=6669 RepID=E9HCV0_DAPPU|nr:hypothetical protein DAPPUDRAFT_309438 [Daphnia pulex]|eukprot:EFX70458.1 hypothetical protein DAPPUDRAFT_309438 [Daphnia pulex]
MAPTISDSDDDSFFDDEDEEMSSDECQSKPITEPQSSKPKLSKHLEQLQSRLGLKELKNKLATPKEEQPKPLTVRKSEPLVVVYNDPSKRKKLKKSHATQNSSSQVEDNYPEPEEFNLIKTKHEVKKFTIKALKKTSKNQAQIALAVSLGAKPPKAMPVNYKVMQHCKKKEEGRQKRLKQAEHIFATKLQLPNKKKGPRRDRNKVVNFDAGFGKFGPKLQKQIKNAKKSKK